MSSIEPKSMNFTPEKACFEDIKLPVMTKAVPASNGSRSGKAAAKKAPKKKRDQKEASKVSNYTNPNLSKLFDDIIAPNSSNESYHAKHQKIDDDNCEGCDYERKKNNSERESSFISLQSGIQIEMPNTIQQEASLLSL